MSPGLIAADVQGSRPRPYRTRLTLQTLTDAQWDAFLDEVAAHAGHMAALLDGDMPHELVDAAHAVGVPLLPGPGDLEPECSCPDWGHPCKHAAALCYQAGWLLGAEPLVLLLMRGRGEEQVRAELDERNARHAGMAPVAEPDAPPPGVPARMAYAADVTPAGSAGPVHGAPAALVVEPAPGIDPEVLAALVSAAAARAGDLVASPDDPLSEREELVRLAAALAGRRCRLASREPRASSTVPRRPGAPGAAPGSTSSTGCGPRRPPSWPAPGRPWSWPGRRRAAAADDLAQPLDRDDPPRPAPAAVRPGPALVPVHRGRGAVVAAGRPGRRPRRGAARAAGAAAGPPHRPLIKE